MRYRDLYDEHSRSITVQNRQIAQPQIDYSYEGTLIYKQMVGFKINLILNSVKAVLMTDW